MVAEKCSASHRHLGRDFACRLSTSHGGEHEERVGPSLRKWSVHSGSLSYVDILVDEPESLTTADRVLIGYEALLKATDMAPRGITAGMSREAGMGIAKLPPMPKPDTSVAHLDVDLLCNDE